MFVSVFLSALSVAQVACGGGCGAALSFEAVSQGCGVGGVLRARSAGAGDVRGVVGGCVPLVGRELRVACSPPCLRRGSHIEAQASDH